MPGIDHYRCCPHNYGMGWPYFTEELWLATPDKGLAAAMYAPSPVTAKVGRRHVGDDHRDTDYPFGDTITLTVSTPRPWRSRSTCACPAGARRRRSRSTARAGGRRPGPAFVDRQPDLEQRRHRHDHAADRTSASGPGPRTTTRQRRPRPADLLAADRRELRADRRQRRSSRSTRCTPPRRGTTAWPAGARTRPRPLTFHNSGGGLATNAFTQGGNPADASPPRRRRSPTGAPTTRRWSDPAAGQPARSAPDQTSHAHPMGAARLRITSFPVTASSGSTWTLPARASG